MEDVKDNSELRRNLPPSISYAKKLNMKFWNRHRCKIWVTFVVIKKNFFIKNEYGATSKFVNKTLKIG